MKPTPILDTHIWLWWLLGDSRLTDKEAAFLDDLPTENRPCISAISLWELATLVDLGRVELDESLESFLTTAASAKTVRTLPITTEVVVEMNRLPAAFHRDPADRLIVASAIATDRSLATRDRRIMESGMVAIWGLTGE